MKLKVIFVLSIILSFFSLKVSAQKKWVYSVDFATMFDNSEKSGNYTAERTAFSVFLAPEVGVSLEGKHKLMGGINGMQVLGDSILPTKLDYTIYYQFNNGRFNVNAGSIPRKHLVGKYPKSFFYTNFAHYKNNIKGAVLSHSSKNGYVEFLCDWYRASVKNGTDEFMVAASSEYELLNKHFIIGGNTLLNHCANSAMLGEDAYLMERVQYNAYIGVNFKPLLPKLDIFRIHGGVMSTLERLRSTVSDDLSFTNNLGWQIDAEIGYKRAKLINSTFWGDPQFKYIAEYGDRIYSGAPYYSTNFYNRVEASYTYEYKFLKFSGILLFHITKSDVAYQQVVKLEISLDGILSKK